MSGDGFHMTPDEFRRHGHDVVEWVARYMERVGDLPIQPARRAGRGARGAARRGSRGA